MYLIWYVILFPKLHRLVIFLHFVYVHIHRCLRKPVLFSLDSDPRTKKSCKLIWLAAAAGLALVVLQLLGLDLAGWPVVVNRETRIKSCQGFGPLLPATGGTGFRMLQYNDWLTLTYMDEPNRAVISTYSFTISNLSPATTRHRAANINLTLANASAWSGYSSSPRVFTYIRLATVVFTLYTLL